MEDAAAMPGRELSRLTCKEEFPAPRRHGTQLASPWSLFIRGLVVGRQGGWSRRAAALPPTAPHARGIRFLIAREGNEIAVTRGAGASPGLRATFGMGLLSLFTGDAGGSYRVRLRREEAAATSARGSHERWRMRRPT